MKIPWTVTYKQAYDPDTGRLFFPDRLSEEYLQRMRKKLGSYMFANQYQNEIVPTGQQAFRKEWLKYYDFLPRRKHTFAFIDPAISEEVHACYTALTVIDTDEDMNWYLRNAQRFKINATQIVDLIFKVHAKYAPNVIGIEDVAFQKAILHFLAEEMRRRNVMVPATGIKQSTQQTKEMRILGVLVPRFEWQTIMIAQGLNDFEMEYSQFPRSAHVDLLDSLASMESIVTYPTKERKSNEPPSQNSPEYEKWYIQNIHRQQRQRDREE